MKKRTSNFTNNSVHYSTQFTIYILEKKVFLFGSEIVY